MRMRSGRAVRSLGLAGLLVVGAECSKKEEAPPPPSEPAAPVGRVVAPPPTPPAGTVPREGTAEANPPVHVVVPSDAGTPGTPAEAAPPAPPPGSDEAAPPAASDAAPPSAAPSDEAPKNAEWTAGVVELKARTSQQATLVSVRTGTHADYDRVVFEFEGAQLPGYHVEYVDSPVTQCGSGNEVKLAGQGWLQVRFTPARAHTEQGQPTVAARELKPALPIVLELERTCDFEGEVTWVLGNAHPNKYRVLELREPTRLVVDVRH